MAWHEESFGKVLYKDLSKFKYTRIPNIVKEYFITTNGLVIRGGKKGPGDLLEWDKIKEPGTADGLSILGFDIAGTVKFNTPITLTVIGKDGKSGKQEFPQMSSEFYYKLMSAWHVAKMFNDESIRIEALTIWSKNLEKRRLMTKEEYLQEICRKKITRLFFGRSDYKKAALEMYERGKLKFDDFKKTNYEIEQMVKEYLNKKSKSNKIGFSTSTGNEFRESMRYTPNSDENISQGNKGSWGNVPPHMRFGKNEGKNR